MNPMALAGIGMGVSGLGSLVGGLIGSNAAEDAAAAQTRALQEAIALQRQQYETSQKQIAPYVSAGAGALENYRNLASGLTQPGFTYEQKPFSYSNYDNPGARYAMQQAAQAINESSIARGAAGGGTAKAIAQQINDIAGQNYNNAFEQWLKESQLRQGQAENKYARDLGFQNQKIGYQKDIADTGLNASLGGGQLGQRQTESIGGLMGDVGAAKATGKLAGASALTSGVSGLGNAITSGLGMLYGSKNPNQAVWG